MQLPPRPAPSISPCQLLHFLQVWAQLSLFEKDLPHLPESLVLHPQLSFFVSVIASTCFIHLITCFLLSHGCDLEDGAGAPGMVVVIKKKGLNINIYCCLVWG